MDENEKRSKDKEIISAAVSADSIQRYGSAIKEHLVSFNGKDFENNIKLTKSLKSISSSKVHPIHKKSNIKQQAGFSAEVKEVANINAERAISSSKKRVIRTDDLGHVNDPLYDHVEIDSKGSIIYKSGSQMKFVGRDSGELLEKLLSKKYQKYIDEDAKITVPSDLYDSTSGKIMEEVSKVEKRLDVLMKSGKPEEIEQTKLRLNNLRTLQKNLRKSTLSSEDAIFARKHPKISVMRDSTKLAHRSGMETAKKAVVIGGGVSLIKNTVSYVKGEIELQEATKNIGKETAKTAIYGYGTGAVGSVVKGVMQNSSVAPLRLISKSNLPAAIVHVSLSTSKTLMRYYQGDLSGVECFEEIGEDGVSLVSSAMFATLGQMLIPVPVVGALAGSMVGYMLASSSYKSIIEALKEESYAKEHRIRLEQECLEHIELIRAYREELEQLINKYLSDHVEFFHYTFTELKSSLEIGDVDGYIKEMNKITNFLGGESQFQSITELETLMQSEDPFKL